MNEDDPRGLPLPKMSIDDVLKSIVAFVNRRLFRQSLDAAGDAVVAVDSKCVKFLRVTNDVTAFHWVKQPQCSIMLVMVAFELAAVGSLLEKH